MNANPLMRRLVIVSLFLLGCTDSGFNIRSSTDTNGSSATPSDEALPSADFNSRCADSGVLVCRGFDTVDDLARQPGTGQTGALPDGSGSYSNISIDFNQKSSGAGSLRFQINGRTPANHSGAFQQLMGRNFGPGTTMYVQFRIRMSEYFVNTNWDSLVSSSPKLVILHHNSATCNDIEWTQMLNGWYENIPTMYTDCGAQGLNSTIEALLGS